MSLVESLKKGSMVSWEYSSEDSSYVVVFMYTDINGKEAVCSLKLCSKGNRSLFVGGGPVEFLFHPLPIFFKNLLEDLEKMRKEREGLDKLHKAIYS